MKEQLELNRNLNDLLRRSQGLLEKLKNSENILQSSIDNTNNSSSQFEMINRSDITGGTGSKQQDPEETKASVDASSSSSQISIVQSQGETDGALKQSNSQFEDLQIGGDSLAQSTVVATSEEAKERLPNGAVI